MPRVHVRKAQDVPEEDAVGLRITGVDHHMRPIDHARRLVRPKAGGKRDAPRSAGPARPFSLHPA
ncbi:hypothetical protein GCM10011579_079060 [Streptomyces albiflavescens]|uniref:Uncharacterized protein n=1 Tax=Streptomyces albiflavescens TaxID=1623582 RepID=A0A917YCQ5_9ACTN|nr:hypothetical protein GCM10011579_079060 [Streptomyces albiflavescens]